MNLADLAPNAYPWLKAFHVIAVIASMAGIFYLPRSSSITPGLRSDRDPSGLTKTTYHHWTRQRRGACGVILLACYWIRTFVVVRTPNARAAPTDRSRMRPRVNGPRSLIRQLIDRPVLMTVTSTIEPSRRVRWAQPICDGTKRCPSARREPASEPYILASPSSPEAGPPATTNKSSRPLTTRRITFSQVAPPPCPLWLHDDPSNLSRLWRSAGLMTLLERGSQPKPARTPQRARRASGSAKGAPGR